MSAKASTRQATSFKLGTVLALVVFGFLAFIALLYFIGAGETGKRNNDGRAHAASNGLNGFSGLAKLLEAEGVDVRVSRTPSALETYDLLVLTPPPTMDPEDLSDLLEKRQYLGPTLVILPKWYAAQFPDTLPEELQGKVKDGWVRLMSSYPPEWTADLATPYNFESTSHEAKTSKLNWSGTGHAGALPTKSSLAAVPSDGQDVLVEDSEGGALVIDVIGKEDTDFYNEAQNTLFIVEPDLVNNYGLADPNRAALALELVQYASYYEETNVTFDLTLNGMGGTTNLLTLAFRPPFLAATLCLILALFIIGWRAFRRFGPAIAEGPAIAFGKRRLVANGAGLILRAKRLGLLAEPFIGLTERRLKDRLGIARGDAEAINTALAVRIPDTPTFTDRADALRSAKRSKDILHAAKALKELEGNLTR